MKKTFKTTDMNGAINVEYDETKFDISIIKSENRVIVRRISDDTILKSFTNIGFIVQTETEEVSNFVISEYYKTIKNDIEVKLKHYTVRKYEEEFELKKEFECDSAWLEGVRILDNLYLVESTYYGGCLYNLKAKSKHFERIYNDKKLLEDTNREFILVNERRTAPLNCNITDLLTYGIDPSTYEIVTPIWSELQQRSFSIYTDEERKALNQLVEKQGKYRVNENYNNEHTTICFEVQRYLDEIDEQFGCSENVYNSPYCRDINESFVKKITTKKQ